MNRRFTVTLTLIMTALVPVAICGDQSSREVNGNRPSAEKTADGWMKGKLRSAQRIFDGLTNGDLEAVESSARRMHGLNVLEQWVRSNEYVNQSKYKGQLNAFEFATKELIRLSEAKDIDGALEAYVQMSRSCVRCHTLVRDRTKSDVTR